MTQQPADSPAAPPPPRKRRWRRWLAGVALAATAACAVVYFAVLPWVVRKSATDALTNLGVADPRFDVARATLWGSALARLTAAGGDLQAASVDVTYHPLKIISGQLDEITLDGVRIRLAIRDGKVDFPVKPPDEPPAHAAETLDLPFRTLTIKSSTAVVEWEGQVVEFPLSGTVTNRGVDDVAAEVEVRLAPPAADLTLPGGAKLRGPGGVLHLGATVRAAGLDVRLAGDSWLGFQELVVGAAPDVTTLGETRVTFVAATDHPLARIPLGADAPPPSVQGTLAVRTAAVNHATFRLALGGVAFDIPVAFNAPAPPGQGAFEIASVVLDQQALEPVRGTLGVVDRRADFSLRWAALPDALLTADGWLALGAAGVEGKITASVPPFQLDKSSALASRVAALEGWDVTGTLGAVASVAFEKGKPAGAATLNVTNVEAASKDAGVELHGVNGTVTVNFAESASTPLTQRVTVERMALGTLEWTDAVVVFSLKDANHLFINELSAGWLGGRVSTAGVRINPSEPKFEATLVADRISLSQLLALAAEGRARGEGLMAGRVPVKVDWPTVSFGTGFLRSQSATGELQVLDTPWLGDIMDQSDPRFTTDRELAEVKTRILRALTDFEYDRLTFAFEAAPESRGLLRVNTHGKGRQGAKPQELDLTLNIRGIDDLLKYGLRSKQKYDELTNPQFSN